MPPKIPGGGGGGGGGGFRYLAHGLKNNWVDKDLSKSLKKKCFEQNTVTGIAQKNRTTKNWVEEDLNKFPKKKKTLKRQSKCHVFVKQVCFSYGESPRTPPLEGTLEMSERGGVA